VKRVDNNNADTNTSSSRKKRDLGKVPATLNELTPLHKRYINATIMDLLKGYRAPVMGHTEEYQLFDF